MTVGDIQIWFPHPRVEELKIPVIFDVCHMIKLICNLLGDVKAVQSVENNRVHTINWHYTEALNDV